MKYNHRERGVALLLALGFSALLLVLVMAFATNALLENKVANANSSREKGRITGEVALSRALAALRYYDQAMQSYKDYGLFRFDNIVSRSNNAKFTTWDDQYFVGLKEAIGTVEVNEGSTAVPVLKTGGDIVYIYPKTPDIDVDSTYYPNANRNVGLQQFQWQYVYDSPPAGEGNTPRIIGRFAYAVLPDMGTLHKSLFNGYSQSSSRIGDSMKDLPLSVFANDLVKGDGSSFSDPLGTIKTKTSAGSTHFEQQVLDGLFTTSADKRSQSDTPLKIYSMLDLDSSLSQYVTKWFDAENSTYRDRFDISSAPSSTVSGMKSALPYLGKLPDQVAANLIDYMDSDSTSTSDRNTVFNTNNIDNDLQNVSLPDFQNAYSSRSNLSQKLSGSWLDPTVTPAYAGNERTPYFSELAVNVETAVRADLQHEPVNTEDLTQGYYVWWENVNCTTQMHIAGEIVNLFPNLKIDADTEKNVKGTYRIRIYFYKNPVTGDSAAQTNAKKSQLKVGAWVYVGGTSSDLDSDGYKGVGTHSAALPEYVDIGDFSLGNDVGYFYKTVSIPNQASISPGSLKAYKRKTNEENGNGGNKIIIAGGTYKVKISRIILMKKENGSQIWRGVDYVDGFSLNDKLNQTITGGSWSWDDAGNLHANLVPYDENVDKNYCVSYIRAARDVRNNMSSGNYYSNDGYSSGGNNYATVFSGATLGNYNSNALQYVDDFDGKSGDPMLDFNNSSNYVPCYVKDAPMESAEEFRFIPRGEVNRSLNLSKRASDNLSSVNYSDGDAAILDQIKVGNESSREKLSINTRNEIIWKMIFSGIKYNKGFLRQEYNASTKGNTYVENNPSDTGDKTLTLGLGDAGKLAAKMQKILRDKAIFFQYPSQLLSPVKDISGNDSSTDKTLFQYLIDQAKPDSELTAEQQGILISKVAPLLKAPRLPESFYVLVLAQSIQDVGGDGSSISISRVKNDGTTVSQDCKLGNFDFKYNSGNIIYFDRITSQNRMLVKVLRTEDANGKSTFKIARVEYLSE